MYAAVILGNQLDIHKRAPSSGGHTQPAEFILCTSSFKRTTFKKPDAARLSSKNYSIIFSNFAKRKEKGGDNREQKVTTV